MNSKFSIGRSIIYKEHVRHGARRSQNSPEGILDESTYGLVESRRPSEKI
jgi:hypothetical protein